MAADDYERVMSALEAIRELARKADRSAVREYPLAVCAVDRELRLHVARKTSEGGSIEYAIIDARAVRRPVWRTVASDIDYGYPSSFFQLHGSWALGVVGTKGTKDEVALARRRVDLGAYYVLLDAAPRATVDLGVRVAEYEPEFSTAQSTLYLLLPKWQAAIALKPNTPLSVWRFGEAKTALLADPIDGTDWKESFAPNYTIHATTERLHVVYIGRRDRMDGWAERFWHLQLDTNGRLLGAAEIGLAPKKPLLTRIIASPAGELWMLNLSGDRDSLEARIVSLKASGASGAAPKQYVIDPWLRAHELTFDGQGRPLYRGPATVRGAK